MNKSRFIASFLLGASLAVACPAYAQNVTAPQNNNQSKPNLGLLPSPKNAKPAQSGKKQDTKAEPSAPAAPAMPALSSAPPQGISPQQLDQLRRGALENSRAQAAQYSQKNSSFLPSSIIDVSSQGTGINPNTTALSNRMVIASAGQPAWSQGDLEKISASAGWPAASIPQQCTISYTGSVTTDRGSYDFNQGSKTSAETGYDGRVQSVSVIPFAFCNQTQRPQNSGPIVRMDGKFMVPLVGKGNCEIPPTISGRNLRLAIQYMGDGQVRCQPI